MPPAEFCEQGFKVLTDQNIDVFTDQELEVLTDQGLEVLTECDQGHGVYIDLSLSNSKEECVMFDIGDEGVICDLGKEVVKILDEVGQEEVKNLGEGGEGELTAFRKGQEELEYIGEGDLEGLEVAREDLNPTQDSKEVVLLGEGEGPKRDVVELYSMLEGGEGGGEIEMFHVSELQDDLGCLGEAGDTDNVVEIVMEKEAEEKQQVKEAFEVEPNPGKIACIARDKSVKRKYCKRTVSSREFFLRLRK